MGAGPGTLWLDRACPKRVAAEVGVGFARGFRSKIRLLTSAAAGFQRFWDMLEMIGRLAGFLEGCSNALCL